MAEQGREAIAIVGATATGKTALAVHVARLVGGEIVSVDSRQAYRGLDIGTAKPTPAERAAVPHHGLDVVSPDERYSAGAFARDARRAVGDIRSRGNAPILVGGTGFFLRALTTPLFAEPPLPPDVRRRLGARLERLPASERRRWLERLDPGAAATLATAGGRQRVLRALEVVLLTGRPLAWWHRNAPPLEPPLRPLAFLLELPREALYRRIDERVHRMFEAGWLEEVRALLDGGWTADAPAFSAAGYRHLAAHLRGEMDLAAAIESIQRETRNYARRQITWFRHQLPDDVVRLDATRPVEEAARKVAQRWEEEGSC